MGSTQSKLRGLADEVGKLDQIYERHQPKKPHTRGVIMFLIDLGLLAEQALDLFANARRAGKGQPELSVQIFNYSWLSSEINSVPLESGGGGGGGRGVTWCT